MLPMNACNQVAVWPTVTLNIILLMNFGMPSAKMVHFDWYLLVRRGLAYLMQVVQPSLNPDTEKTSFCTSGQTPF